MRHCVGTGLCSYYLGCESAISPSDQILTRIQMIRVSWEASRLCQLGMRESSVSWLFGLAHRYQVLWHTHRQAPWYFRGYALPAWYSVCVLRGMDDDKVRTSGSPLVRMYPGDHRFNHPDGFKERSHVLDL